MGKTFRKRIATILRALAARLHRQPEPTPWVPSVNYRGYGTSSAAAEHVRYTHGGDTVGP